MSAVDFCASSSNQTFRRQLNSLNTYVCIYSPLCEGEHISRPRLISCPGRRVDLLTLHNTNAKTMWNWTHNRFAFSNCVSRYMFPNYVRFGKNGAPFCTIRGVGGCTKTGELIRTICMQSIKLQKGWCACTALKLHFKHSVCGNYRVHRRDHHRNLNHKLRSKPKTIR